MTQTYTYSPRPVGGPISFAIKGDMLIVDSGRKVHEVRLGAVDTVRMTYEPGRIGQKSFRTKVTMKDGKTFTFSSLNWKSLVEAQEMAAEYRAFARNLCEAIVTANPQARFIAGKPWWLWASTTVVAILSLLMMAYLIWQALRMGSTGVALIGALLAVVGTWQIEPMVRLNKPRVFTSGALPEELMPKAS
ncbi:hypothetical protein MHY87_00840 [Microvirga sp. ACRRW]|uniref:hypothetical protein n=1 Tax=Microvirga sp. ACRRW TaxID=2918205 RepID=UPI001EF58F06|nr:hypothetical protein [Microvirga sp. ACRRW]MCG7391453.1 hypothetical protein [Microvirga sp. ACRRW]